MRRTLLTLLMYWLIPLAHAATPLPVAQAFALTGYIDASKQLVLHWQIAPDYYLYRDQIKIISTDKNKVRLGNVIFPTGMTRQDELHGVFQSYAHSLSIRVPILSSAASRLNLNISYQGCSTKGFCYPPVTENLSVNLTQITKLTNVTDNLTALNHAYNTQLSQQGYITQLLLGRHLVFIMLSFLGLGLLLAFTPCVLPMVPILSSIIVGYGKNISTGKAFSLSLAYVLGVAITYALAGVVVALAGSSIQVALQKPWVIGGVSSLFVLLAFSLFGFYDLKLPSRLQQRLTGWGERHQGGTYIGVFLMGGFSTLVVSPCISAPLVGALTYIAETGDVVLGATALLALGLGMGIPLLLIGASAGKLLPRSGPWMDKIKQLFGLLMLGLAIWMLARILPAGSIALLWAMLAIITAVWIWEIRHTQWLWRKLHQGVGLLILGYGFILIVASLFGTSDPLHPWQHWHASQAATPVSFVVVKDMDALEQELALAKAHKKPVLLDFYADWCVSCVLMDRYVFNRPAIKRVLDKFILLRADVTQNNVFDQAVLKRFDVIAPPTMIFFNTRGEELSQQEIVGEVDEKEFLADLMQLQK